jgi:hypothetical protein
MTADAAPPQMSSPLAGPVSGPMFPAMPLDPSSMLYDAETQSDGTILLRIKNPDGTLGPVVQHLPAPKPKTGAPK